MEVTSQTIEDLRDVMLDPGLSQHADPEWLSHASRIFDDHVIERYEIPSKNPGVSGNPGASPGQIEFQKQFFSRKHDCVAAAGANQSSKTVCVGGMCVCKWIRDFAQDGDIYWVIAQTRDTIRDIPHRTIWEFLPKSMFPKDVIYQPRTGFGLIPTLWLTLPDGRGKCEVWFKTEEADIKVFESSRVNGIWWSECRREAIWDALQPRMLARTGWIAMDFISVEPWHKYRIRLKAGSEASIYHQVFTMPQNAHNLGEGAISRACANMTSEQIRVRVHGEEGSDRGIVYQAFDDRKHSCLPFKIPYEWPKWRCYDHGFINPSVLLWVAIIPTGFRFPEGIGGMWEGRVSDREIALVYREFYQVEVSVPNQAKIIKTKSGSEVYRLGGKVIADPSIFNRNPASGSRSESVAAHFANHGLRMKKGKKGRGPDMHAQVAKVQLWFESDKILFFNTCNNAIYEHSSWRFKQKKDGDFAGSEPYVDKNDHSCDAFRYLLQERLTYSLPVAMFETASTD